MIDWNFDMAAAPRDIETPVLLWGRVYWFDPNAATEPRCVIGSYWGDGEWRADTENPYADYILPVAWAPLEPPANTRDAG
jgi:hypothetical protein